MRGGRGWGVGLLVVALATSGVRAPAAADAARMPMGARRAWDLALGPDGPRAHVLELALRAYECGRTERQFAKPILTIIDYSLPSDARRLWVVDVDRGRVLFHDLVAHGRGTGDRFARMFSNRPGSLQSSLGLFRTAHTYMGAHGYSLNLIGLEPDINDRALDRRIVMHGAEYVRPELARGFGRIGRSWGCPALDPRIHRAVIDVIKDGSAVFAYYPDRRWLARSRFLACGAHDERWSAPRPRAPVVTSWRGR